MQTTARRCGTARRLQRISGSIRTSSTRVVRIIAASAQLSSLGSCVWDRPLHGPSGVADSTEADDIFGAGPVSPTAWQSNQTGQPALSPSPFFSGRSGQLGTLDGLSSPSQQVCHCRQQRYGVRDGVARPKDTHAVSLMRLKQPKFETPARPAAADLTTHTSLWPAERSVALPRDVSNGLADPAVRSGLAALLDEVRPIL